MAEPYSPVGRAAALSSSVERMAEHFETRQWVPFSVEAVFAFFAVPRNLPRLMPAELQTRIEGLTLVPPPSDPPQGRRTDFIAAGVGSEIVLSFQPIPWLRHRSSWTARIVKFEWNRYFCDAQVQGPFAAFVQRHGTQPETRDGVEGTLVSDDIEYTLPFGPLGRLGRSFVRKQLEASFAHRQQRLLQILKLEARVAASQI